MTEKENPKDNPGSEEESAAKTVPARFDTIKVYLKDVSFEAPSTPKVFTETEFKPKMDLQIGIDYRAIDEKSGITEIVLKATVTATFNDNTAYIAEVHQAGLFRIQHPDSDTRQVVIEVACPNILLPFAREEINNLVTKGGFTSFLLSPVNFEALFRSKQQKSEDPNPATDAPAQTH